jgi:hypothetical protein
MAGVAQSAVTQSIEPQRIDLGEAAQLTIAESGDDAQTITPPMVAGLEFVAVGQSQRVESINGVTHSTTSVTYQVIPRQAGVFTIPGKTPGTQPLVLTVGPNQGSAAAPVGSRVPLGAPSAGSAAAGSSAFVRLRVSKHELYVGETIPVDIQVGTRDGVVASLNGLPTLNGDAFTMDKLSSQPQRAEEVIDGKPYTVFTWHGVLAAVKPGALSLTMETPLTVRVRTAARADTGQLGADDLFNDPAFQNFFGASTEREVTVASSPTAFTVLGLPANDRPANFSGAVGHFSISSDISDDKAAAGDPLTLRMHVTGTGNFDRVSTRMLHDVEQWKTYAPTATFKADDEIGYRGDKTFEQAVIAMQPGAQSLPALTFSWFDPSTRQYVQARTSALAVAIKPASADSSVALVSNAPAAGARISPASDTVGDGLRADHFIDGGTTALLTPHYYQATYLGIPSALALAFCGAWFWVRRREHAAAAGDTKESPLNTAPLVNLMDDAVTSGDPELFFKSARAALQRALASKWQIATEAITVEEVDARLGAKSDVARVFTLADEAAYAGGYSHGDRVSVVETIGASSHQQRSNVMKRNAAVISLSVVLLGFAALRVALPSATIGQPPANGAYSASSLYDLGNSYARAGQPALAVLNYERARVLAPTDPDIRANLQRVRESAGLPTQTAGWLARHDRLANPNTLYWLGLFGLILTGVSLLLRRPRSQHRGILRATVLVGVLSISLSLFDATVTASMLHESVVMQATTAGASPISGAEPLYTVPQAAVVSVRDEHRGFALIVDSQGREGWVAGADLTMVIPDREPLHGPVT